MIPKTVSLEDFEMEEQPSYTHKMRLDDKRIIGYAENIEAVKQSAYKILGTERYQYVMYSWDYGLETLDLFGEPVSYVCPELERRITEALTYLPYSEILPSSIRMIRSASWAISLLWVIITIV